MPPINGPELKYLAYKDFDSENVDSRIAISNQFVYFFPQSFEKYIMDSKYTV